MVERMEGVAGVQPDLQSGASHLKSHIGFSRWRYLKWALG